MGGAQRAGTTPRSGVAGRKPGSYEPEFQRRRVLASVEDLCARGTTPTTVSSIIRHARISRRSFYELFDNAEACRLAALERGAEAARARACVAYAGGHDWRGRVRGVLVAVLTFLDENPGFARLWLIDGVGDGPRVVARRTELLAELADVIDRGAPGAGSVPSPLAAEAMVAGIEGVLRRRLDGGGHRRSSSPLDLTNQLMSVITRVYLDASAARAELDRPLPRRPRGAQVRRRPQEHPGLRITYRTELVLRAVDEHPGSSNAALAARSDIADPGQISKMLSRLASHDLIENFGAGQAGGAANAWRLTRAGERVLRATGALR